MRINREQFWRQLGQEIEQQRSVGEYGMCAYLNVKYKYEDRGYSQAAENQFEGHLRAFWRRPDAGDYFDRPGVWGSRALLAYFLAEEAADARRAS